MSNLVMGADFGTDSVRAVVVDSSNGKVLGQGVAAYPRWKKGLYCNPQRQQFRQHPLDYLESLEKAVREALVQAGPEVSANVRALSIDTTGSTPVFADAAGSPLALRSEFAETPEAMFLLWKDHTSIAEAEEINTRAAKWKEQDVLKYVGGIYSSEWFWAKALHVLRRSDAVSAAAVTIVEHCDWISACLSGTEAPNKIKRSRCAAGHKALWHKEFGGYPRAFLKSLDPRLEALAASLGNETWTSDHAAGTITPEWAAKLGLPANTIIGVGAFDVHMGALGGGISHNQLVKVIGTSCCDVLTSANTGAKEVVVAGICGQVDGSIIPGALAYEAGQSAYGDVFAWFRDLLAWPLRTFLPSDQAEKLIEDIIPGLEQQANSVQPGADTVLALDWLNGRRTPDADQTLSGALTNLRLGTDAPRVYRALIEATAYGSRAIVERFEQQGVQIDGIIGIGGITRKSKLVMQILADVLKRPIRIGSSDQACALGASMFAATAAGLFPKVEEAQKAMFSGFDLEFKPNSANAATYDELYKNYKNLGKALSEPKLAIQA